MMTDPKAKFGRMVGTRFIDRRNIEASRQWNCNESSVAKCNATRPLAKENPRSPERFVAVTLGLGLVASNLVPEQRGCRLSIIALPSGHGGSSRSIYGFFRCLTSWGKGWSQSGSQYSTDYVASQWIFRSSEKYNFSRSVSCEVSRK